MKRLLCFFVFTFIMFSTDLRASRWQVLLYMDSSDELSDMAIKNITDLLHVPLSDTIDFHVQLHAYDHAALRYKVTSHGLQFVEEKELSEAPKDDLIDAAQWAFSSSDEDYYMLIFWNHGWGALDPQWNADAVEWQVESEQEGGACSIKRSRMRYEAEHKKRHKGFMFSASPRIYLSNPAMGDALATIKTEVLKNKKIDIVAFDTCMGGMLEVAYQLAPYASYLVGNQVCSLRDGFDYDGLAKALNKNKQPLELAQDMVHIFDAYYAVHDSKGIYAHTALDLEKIPSVTNALDAVVSELLAREDGMQLAHDACVSAPRFCMFPMYTDLIAYIKSLELQVRTSAATAQKEVLFSAIENVYQAMDQCVVARCAGFAHKDKAHGCAIYAPMYAPHDSYYATHFACNSQWLYLLKQVEKEAQS